MKSITKRKDDYSQWYLDVIASAELADSSPVRGCMVIKPHGYALWEKIQQTLDGMIKETGVENVYFPLFIPMSFLAKEAEHVEGFAKECAVVTHHRLKLGSDKKLKPEGKLEEPLIIRPTSETIMYDTFSKWINSYRDLPLLVNQWANIVRWEMRTRPFLRTMEFLWQEGHTAHASKGEADARAKQMLKVYKRFMEDYLAIPSIIGTKTEAEKFAGADYTYSVEAMMQSNKALQLGTSHMLGQNFAKAFNIKFIDKDKKEKLVWQTSWGVSTRLIGALIMAHGDDKGLIIPPKLAPISVVTIPIWTSEKEQEQAVSRARAIAKELERKLNIKVKLDDRDMRPGPKFYEWEKKGIPLRLEIGPKDVKDNSVVVVRRDDNKKNKVDIDDIANFTKTTLDDIQESLFNKALKFQEKNTKKIDSWDKFKDIMDKDGGFALAHWCGSEKCEDSIVKETKATIRCIPIDKKKEKGKCIFCNKPSDGRVIFAKAY